MTMSKEYETIDTVKQRDLLETTRNLGRLLTEEEFNEIMMIYKKVIVRHWNEIELKGDCDLWQENLRRNFTLIF